MNVLVINCGSSSLKYQLLNMDGEQIMAKGLVERIGLAEPKLIHQKGDGDKLQIDLTIKNHTEAISEVLSMLTHPELGVISDVQMIDAIGHRVVHGGERFNVSVLVTPEVLEGIKACIDIAPLHNPPNVAGIEACAHILPGISQAVVFDTSFHQTMPKAAYLYGLPIEYYQKYGIRRYGFHGTSHRYVSQRVAQLENRPLQELKIISCHLGNGSSVTAITGGQSVATSMGLTPLEGLIMGTRTGDMDPAAVLYVMEKENISIADMNNLLNKRSGVLGVSEISSDFRDLEQAAAQGKENAAVALEMFYNGAKKYIGAYIALLNGVDCLVFTAGVGENSSFIREKICSNMGYLGIELDEQANQTRGQEMLISTPESSVKVWIVPTNEELMIARDTVDLIRNNS